MLVARRVLLGGAPVVGWGVDRPAGTRAAAVPRPVPFSLQEGPLPVAEVHARASRALPGLGVATVYRTVKLLLATEQIVAVDFPGEEPHYEPAGRGHHHHFRCLSCRHWFEMCRCLVALPDGTTLPEGFVVEAHQLTLYGRCPRCAAGELDRSAPPG